MHYSNQSESTDASVVMMWEFDSTLNYSSSTSTSQTKSSHQPCSFEYVCTNRRSDATTQPQWKVNKIDHRHVEKSCGAGLYVGSVLRSSVKTVFKHHRTIVIACKCWYRFLFNCWFPPWWCAHLSRSLTLKPERSSWNTTYCETQPTAKHKLRNDNF